MCKHKVTYYDEKSERCRKCHCRFTAEETKERRKQAKKRHLKSVGS